VNRRLESHTKLEMHPNQITKTHQKSLWGKAPSGGKSRKKTRARSSLLNEQKRKTGTEEADVGTTRRRVRTEIRRGAKGKETGNCGLLGERELEEVAFNRGGEGREIRKRFRVSGTVKRYSKNEGEGGLAKVNPARKSLHLGKGPAKRKRVQKKKAC